MTKGEKIKKIIAKSKEVIKDCVLENGAIVAANTDKIYYPREAHNYRFVWPRDAAFICVAAKYLKIKIQEPFFDWLYERPEDFKREKLLFRRYSTNGRRMGLYDQFQPDQAGAILWAIYVYYENNFKKALKYKDLIERLANGLCNNWNGVSFERNYTDLWESEERKTEARLKNNFTYTLAACARGLALASEIMSNKRWQEVSEQMLKQIESAYNKRKGHFLRMSGRLKDFNIDASLLGLVYPFNILDANDQRMINTVKKIEAKLVKGGGVHRYQFDLIDHEGSGNEGGGAWPLLSSWMAVYWAVKGNKKKANQYFDWVVKKSEDYFYLLPEQIFDDFRVGVFPLAWSHAMFVIACKHLGHIK